MRPFSIGGCFDEIIGLDDIYAVSKVDAGLRWMRASRIDPAGAIMLGDTIHDYEVASALGCRCVLIADGHQSRRQLSACGCEIVDTVSDIPELIGL
jgi:phosphoglycolate phosphatase